MRKFTAIVALGVAAATGTILVDTAPAAAATYRIAYTGGSGVYDRTAPRADAIRGYGPGEGASIDVQCQDLGEPMGPRSNRIWNRAAWNGRTTWIPDAYVNTPAAANAFTAGIPRCTTPAPTGPVSGGATFYTGLGAAGYDQARPHAEFVMSENGSRSAPDWAPGNCSATAADDYPAVVGNQRITTLAGWSLGRLGPLYLLRQNPSMANSINYILMFDPGSDAQLGGSCDARIGASDLLANWLRANPSNRLVIMAGAETAPNRHRGIQEIYFPSIRGQRIASQVLVCNVENDGVPWSHADVMRGYAYMIDRPAPSTCPSGFLGWHP